MYKIISISNEFPNVETTDFSSNVSLTDYDIIIIDPAHVVSSFPKSGIESDNKRYIIQQNAHVLSELIQRRQSEISALLNKGKIIVSFLDPLFNVKLISNSIKNVEVNNYSWIPNDEKRRFTNRLIDGAGTGLNLVEKNHLFAPYFLVFQKEINFKAYIDISISAFDLGDVFAANSADLVVGFSFNISKGIVVFLPRINFNEENSTKFVGVLLQIAKKYFGSEVKSPPPDWTSSFAVRCRFAGRKN